MKRIYRRINRMDSNPSNVVFYVAIDIFFGVVLGVIVYLVWL